MVFGNLSTGYWLGAAAGGSYDLLLDETLLFGGMYWDYTVSPPQQRLNSSVIQWSGISYTSASGAWVSKNSFSTGLFYAGGCGNAETNGAIMCGGQNSSLTRVTTTSGHLNNVVSTKANLSTAVSHCQTGGTLESALNCGGTIATDGYWNGVSSYSLASDAHTTEANLSQGRYYAMAGGSSADHAICCGGWKSDPAGVGVSDRCESFDGSSWTTFDNTNFTAGSHNSSGDGSPDSAIRLAIYSSSAVDVNLNQTWNGTAWTNNTGGNLPSAARTTSLCAGNQDNAIQASGGGTTVCQTWDSSAGAWVSQSSVLQWGSTGGGGNSS